MADCLKFLENHTSQFPCKTPESFHQITDAVLKAPQILTCVVVHSFTVYSSLKYIFILFIIYVLFVCFTGISLVLCRFLTFYRSF